MSRRALTLLHASDLQVGTPFLPQAADALLALAEKIQADVIVVSGDLTQRAKPREFRDARAFLNHFAPTPIIVTPGNHDVPVFRPWERLVAPYGAWRGFTGERELDSVLRIDGATFVALNSSTPYRAIVNGRLRLRQLAFAEDVFRDAPRDDWKIVVAHHHFVRVSNGDGGAPMPGAGVAVNRFAEMGVDAVFGGHVHQLHFNTAADVRGALAGIRPFPIISSGTATSRRGRGPEELANTVCVHRFVHGELTIAPWRREPDGDRFEPLEEVRFPLQMGSTGTGSSVEATA